MTPPHTPPPTSGGATGTSGAQVAAGSGADHVTLTRMTSEDPTYPEFTDDDERRNALQQMRIYEAIVVAANDAHAVLDIVLNASAPDAACRALEDRYGFTETQARAVMDLQIRRLTSADRHTFEQHHQELSARVAVLDERLGGG